jgi:hypothetical protein
MTLANAMILIDQTAVPIALPDIMDDFGVGSQEVQWCSAGACWPSPRSWCWAAAWATCSAGAGSS